VVQEADGNRRLQLEVVLSFVELLLVEPDSVVQDALLEIARSEHLHLHVELPAGLIARLDVQNRQLVVECFLRIERIEQLEFPNFAAGGRI